MAFGQILNATWLKNTKKKFGMYIPERCGLGNNERFGKIHNHW